VSSPIPGDLIRVIVGVPKCVYGILIAPTQNKVELENAVLLEPAWFVLTEYGIMQIDTTHFMVIENNYLK